MHTTSWQDAALFPPIDRRNLSVAVVDVLREHILRGTLRPGDRLPSNRHLARLLGVSVPTLREALHALAALGLVIAHQGVGTFVARRSRSRRLFDHAWRRATTGELAQLRVTIETESARAAARHRRSVHARQLSLCAMDRSVARDGGPDRFVDRDADFHAAMVATAGRDATLAGALHRQLSQRLRPTLIACADALADDDELDRWHRNLAFAIIEGDHQRAARLAQLIASVEAAAVAGHPREPP